MESNSRGFGAPLRYDLTPLPHLVSRSRPNDRSVFIPHRWSGVVWGHGSSSFLRLLVKRGSRGILSFHCTIVDGAVQESKCQRPGDRWEAWSCRNCQALACSYATNTRHAQTSPTRPRGKQEFSNLGDQIISGLNGADGRIGERDNNECVLVVRYARQIQCSKPLCNNSLCTLPTRLLI